ncbi:MAG: PAS domain-containing protein [Candidatus Hodarchaeales archaeon]
MKELKRTQAEDKISLLAQISPGHPIHILVKENRAIEELLSQLEDILIKGEQEQSPILMVEIRAKFYLLQDIRKHYQRQEELLFPLLQQSSLGEMLDISRQDFVDINRKIQEADEILSYEIALPQAILTAFSPLIQAIQKNIRREESIIFPNALEKLKEKDWIRISALSSSYGYCIIIPDQKWHNSHKNLEFDQEISSQMINFSTGRIKSYIFEEIMKNLPIQLSFIDENDNFTYFSPSKEPVFRRTLASLGRNVRHCHPPKSIVHVNKILVNFKKKRRDSEEFWISHKDKFIYFQYHAVRGMNGEYLGTIEMIQDITKIKTLQGEKKLISFAQTNKWED